MAKVKHENGKVLKCLGYTYDGKPKGWLDITESYNKNK